MITKKIIIISLFKITIIGQKIHITKKNYCSVFLIIYMKVTEQCIYLNSFYILIVLMLTLNLKIVIYLINQNYIKAFFEYFLNILNFFFFWSNLKSWIFVRTLKTLKFTFPSVLIKALILTSDNKKFENFRKNFWWNNNPKIFYS